MNCGAVLLAAGLGRRFGGDKLHFQIEGVSLFTRAMTAVPACGFARAAAVSGDDTLLGAAAAAGYLPVRNDAPERGVSHSIQLGLAQMAGMDAVLFAVCDQPCLTAQSVARLTAAAAPGRIAALSWKGKRGNPVVFPREYFPELLALRGDTGGSAVIARHLDRLLLVSAQSGMELCDLDHASALESCAEF